MSGNLSAIIKSSNVYVAGALFDANIQYRTFKKVKSGKMAKSVKIQDSRVFIITIVNELIFVKDIKNCVSIVPELRIKDVAYEYDNLYVIDIDGRLISLGSLYLHEGNFTKNYLNRGTRYRQIYLLDSALVAIDNIGNLWGNNVFYKKFLRQSERRISFSKNPDLVKLTRSINFISLALLPTSLIAIDSEGNVYVASIRDENNLLIKFPDSVESGSGYIFDEDLIGGLSLTRLNTYGIKFKAVSRQYDACFLIDTNDNLWKTKNNLLHLVKQNVEQIASGSLHTMIKDLKGNLFASGSNYSGETGLQLTPGDDIMESYVEADQLFNQIPSPFS